MTKRYIIPFALMLILLLAACGGSTTSDSSQVESDSRANVAAEDQDVGVMNEGSDEAMGDVMMDESSDEAMDDGMMDDSHDEDMADAETAMDDGQHEEIAEGESRDSMEETGEMLPVWQTIALTNAATGESFSLGDFRGKTVFVEPMATWCSNCRAQQGEVREAKAQLGDDVVFIGLSLETNLPPEQLAAYAQDNGFDWTYAVMPVELLAQLTDEFGRSITNAPSTPHFIIRSDGTFSALSTGIDPADIIVTKIQAEQSS
jgi:thiol-disulfide isomerase/thioredoxin